MAKTKKLRPVVVGSDMEVFLEERYSKNTPIGRVQKRKWVPACGQIGGDKHHPIPIPGLEKESGFKMQEDGTALEFNIPASANYEQFSDHFTTALTALSAFLRTKHLTMTPGCDVEFTADSLAKFPQAHIVGCSPDIDAYSRRPREGLTVDLFGNHRFAGGHIHMSYDNPDNVPSWVFARYMDIALTLPYLAQDPQGMRRGLYGLAGLFRETVYGKSSGIEYRTLSNMWHFDPSMRTTVHTYTTNTVAWIVGHPDTASDLFEKLPWGDVKKTIDMENLTHAEELMSLVRREAANYGLSLPKWVPRKEGV